MGTEILAKYLQTPMLIKKKNQQAVDELTSDYTQFSMMDIITEEYTVAQKKKMGIPPNAEARGGKWYIGNEYAGMVVKGKFVPKKKTAAPKKSKKPSTPTKKSKTSRRATAAVDRIKSAKKALYRAAYGSDDEAGYQMARGESVSMSVKQFARITGLSIEEINGLVKQYYPLYSKKPDTYGDPIFDKVGNQVIIHPEFWRARPPKPPKPPKKIKGVEVREPMEFEPDSTGRIRPKIAKSLGIERKPITGEDKKQAKEHDSIASEDEKLDEVLTDWQEGSIWRGTSPKTRERLFREVDSGIDSYDLKVQTDKPLYRGMHFDGKNNKFVKTILNKFRKGAVIKLPPAGFSLDASVAMTFAEVGVPSVSVMLELQAKKQGLRAMHVWGGKKYTDEREVITRSGKYKVLNVILQEFQNAGFDRNENALHLSIQIDQVSAVGESINEGEDMIESEEPENTIDFLMGDLMRHTDENLKKLSKKQTKKLSA